MTNPIETTDNTNKKPSTESTVTGVGLDNSGAAQDQRQAQAAEKGRPTTAKVPNLTISPDALSGKPEEFAPNLTISPDAFSGHREKFVPTVPPEKTESSQPLEGRQLLVLHNLQSNLKSVLPSTYDANSDADPRADANNKESNIQLIKLGIQVTQASFDQTSEDTSAFDARLKDFLASLNKGEFPKDMTKDEANAFLVSGELKIQSDAIDAEAKKGTYGEATQAAYKQVVEWMQQKALPNTIAEMQTLMVPLPPGCPLPATPDIHASKQLETHVTDSFKIDTSSKNLPSENDIQQFGNAFTWCYQCQQNITTAKNQRFDEALENTITKLDLPKGWHKQAGDDPNAWRESAQYMTDLATRTRNYVQSMNNLHNASIHTDHPFPLELPPGAAATYDSNGHLATLKLDLPPDLHQENPANKFKIERLRTWLNVNGDKINQACTEYMHSKLSPDDTVIWADTPPPQTINGVKAKLDSNGNVLALVNSDNAQNSDTALKNNESLQDCNLIRSRFDVKTTGDGKIEVTQHTQVADVPIWGYQNMVGVKNVGQQKDNKRPPFNPDDYVAVQSGDRVELMQAKDLQNYKDRQELYYYGNKAISATMDAAMFASGTIELGASLKGFQLLKIAAKEGVEKAGGEVVSRLAADQLWKDARGGATKFIVGPLGIFNNQGADDNKWLSAINTARGLYFLGDTSYGLGKGGWQFLTGGSAAEKLAASQGFQGLLNTTEKGGILTKNTAWVKTAFDTTNLAFRVTEVGYAPIIGKDLIDEHRRSQAQGHIDPFEAAIQQIGDGRGLQQAEKGDFDPTNPKSLGAAQNVLDGYENILEDGRDQTTKDQVSQIFAQTKTLLDPSSSDEEKQQFKLHLAKDILLPEMQVEKQGLPLQSNPYVKDAAAIAMLYLSRDKDGKLPMDLATVTHAVIAPASYSARLRPNVSHHTVVETLSLNNIVDLLKTDLESQKGSDRGIVTGDLLTRIGALSHQEYAGVLKNVLTNKNSSTVDKMRALFDENGPRLATIIDGLRLQEAETKAPDSLFEQQRLEGKNFGLTSNDLRQTLAKVAQNDQDPDVRVMSAAILAGLEQGQNKNNFLNQCEAMWSSATGKSAGTFATNMESTLRTMMNAPLPSDSTNPGLVAQAYQQKLSLANSIALLCRNNDHVLNDEINQSIAQSFDPSNLAQANAVLKSLSQDRLEQLIKSNPELADQLRWDYSDMLQAPDTGASGWLSQEHNVIELLSHAKDLSQNADQSMQGLISDRIKDLMDAKWYPDLRAAAITTLAQLAPSDSLALIRNHTDSSTESSPKVRFAALQALQKLHDPELPELVRSLQDSEKDIAVASELKKIAFEVDPPHVLMLDSLSSPDYLHAHPELASFAGSEFGWLLDNYPDLTKLLFQPKSVPNRNTDLSAHQAMQQLASELSTLGEKTNPGAIKREWEGLCEKSRSDDAESNQAKYALFYILQNNQLHGTPDQLSGLTTQATQEKTAQALADCCKPGINGCDVSAHLVEQSLMLMHGLSPAARQHLVDAWEQLYNAGSIDEKRYVYIRALALEQ